MLRLMNARQRLAQLALQPAAHVKPLEPAHGLVEQPGPVRALGERDVPVEPQLAPGELPFRFGSIQPGSRW